MYFLKSNLVIKVAVSQQIVLENREMAWNKLTIINMGMQHLIGILSKGFVDNAWVK